MQNAFTLLETLITLTIIALLSLIAIPQYHQWQTNQATQHESQQLIRAITQARQQAILQGQTTTICPYQSDNTCGQNWSTGILLLQNQEILSKIIFQHQAQIFLKTFPAGHEYLLQFAANGYTQTQNGSFYYCPKDLKQAQRIVFNQAGRVYLTQEEATSTCATPPSLQNH